MLQGKKKFDKMHEDGIRRHYYVVTGTDAEIDAYKATHSCWVDKNGDIMYTSKKVLGKHITLEIVQGENESFAKCPQDDNSEMVQDIMDLAKIHQDNKPVADKLSEHAVDLMIAGLKARRYGPKADAGESSGTESEPQTKEKPDLNG